MAMTQLISVALSHRDRFSLGKSRQMFGYEAYHWGIMVMSEADGQLQDCHSFDATDSSEMDPVTYRLTNPAMKWWLRIKQNIDPTLNAKLLGRIVIGQASEEVPYTELQSFFEGVDLPIKNTDPQQSCVTWTMDTIRALQKQGWVEEFKLDQFKDWAVSYADDRMKGSESTEPSVTYYSTQN